jgi:DGQHR domain-containing protein
MSEPTTYELRLPALEVRQGPERALYSFAVDGKLLPLFTTVSRVHRDEEGLQGYQRPEALAHTGAIRAYLESETPMIPNAIVVAFDTRVRFESAGRQDGDPAYATPGHLIIPVDESLPDEEKPGWIVDGQQRSAAVRDADIESFPLCVSAFITNSDGDQRAQFILVNSTKPLPKGLIYELLPTTDGPLPPALMRKRFPSLVLEQLNYDDASPFFQLIQTPTTPHGVVKDNSILRMIENSLSDGALYHYRDPETGTGDIGQIMGILVPFWTAVSKVFDYDWGETPRRSRLMHGVGIAAMGNVMDAIATPLVDAGHVPTIDDYIKELEPLVEVCAWSYGTWTFGPDHVRRWNDLQNTPKDINLLSAHLLAHYRRMRAERDG